jgi:WD40 repeat protein
VAARQANGVYTPAVMFRDVDKRYAKLLPNLVHYDIGWGWDRSIAFAPDGSALAAADFGGAVQRWSLTGTPIGDPLPSQGKQHIRAIAVAPDGRLAAAVHDGTAQIWPERRRAGGIQGRRGHHHRRRLRARRQATRHRRHRRRRQAVDSERHARRHPAVGEVSGPAPLRETRALWSVSARSEEISDHMRPVGAVDIVRALSGLGQLISL